MNVRIRTPRPMGRGLTAALGCTALLSLLAGAAQAQVATGEAPALAALVAAGQLPPVAERVGSEPEVLTPAESIGTYGGEIRFGVRGSSDHNNILRLVGSQGLVRWNPTYTEVHPALAKSVDVDPEGRIFTFHLRAGMHWSDGAPFTADDVMFNVQDLLLNSNFAPPPTRYMAAGVPMTAEKLDDLTVRFSFEAPYGDFLSELASPLGQHPVLYAKHYCSQFHPTYNPDVETLVKSNNASDWQNLFLQKCGDIEIPSRWGNPERPTLDPWVVKEPYSGGATRVVLERNPYFWQVDTAGNQLPYVDRLTASISQDVESLILAAIGGRIDFGLRHLDNPADRPVLAQNREAGDYRFFEAAAPGGVDMIINLNLTHKNPELRELFNKRDFRVALSLGMDRQEIIDTALLGEGEPWQHGPFEDHPYFHEKLSTQFLEYDVDRANALLDGIGMDKRGSDGMRLLPSGKRFVLRIDVIPTFRPQWPDMLQLIEQQWAKIGIDMEVNAMERTLFVERTSSGNDHDAAVWAAVQSWVPGQVPQQIVPVHQDSRWGIPWVDWYNSNGAKGEEPPATVRERLRMYDEARGTPDPERRKALITQIADIAADEFEVIGVSKSLPTYGIAKNKLRNVPEVVVNTFFATAPALALPQTWFWRE